jgi:sugar phosphate isomerase/epimerase
MLAFDLPAAPPPGGGRGGERVQPGPRLSCADYAFPLLAHDVALDLIARLGFPSVDLGLFAGRSHLRPEAVFQEPERWVTATRERLSKASLGVADVFGTPSDDPFAVSLNHPDRVQREEAVAFVEALIAYASSIGATHVTVLPGVAYPGEPREVGRARSATTLQRCIEVGATRGVRLAIEPHLDSIVQTPDEVSELLSATPGLTLTLDPAHFIYQGFSTDAVLPLVKHASHFQLRGAARGRMQVPLRENEVDFARLLGVATERGYHGILGIEYVWMTHWDCDRVDNLSETIQLVALVGQLTSTSVADSPNA